MLSQNASNPSFYIMLRFQVVFLFCFDLFCFVLFSSYFCSFFIENVVFLIFLSGDFFTITLDLGNDP